MKTLALCLLMGLTLIQLSSFSQARQGRDDANGDWTKQYVTLFDTPEADIMVRTGDIDNLGFGWPEGFDPFSGNSTPKHAYPWNPDTINAPGTDRIMVITSYNGSPPHGQDGYTNGSSRPENLPRSIVLSYDLQEVELESAMLQIFVDDFQAQLWHAHYFVSINGVDASYVSEIINSLMQTGPVGKIINVAIPQDQLYLLESDSMSILFDDTITGAGDGYAIDFVKLLMNPKGFSYTAKVYGNVTDIDSGHPIEDAIVFASGTGDTITDQDGYFIFNGLPAGITNLFVTKFSYDTASVLVNLVSGDSVRKDFQLKEILDAEFIADNPVASDAPHTVQFTDLTSMDPTSWNWDFGDGTTSEEQNPSHEYDAIGYYTVTLTASNSIETNTETKVNFIQIGVENIEENRIISEFSVRPNPVNLNGKVSLVLNNSDHICIEIYDLTGKVVQTIYDQPQKAGKYSFGFSTDELTNGLYLIVVRAGNKNLTKKIFVLNE